MRRRNMGRVWVAVAMGAASATQAQPINVDFGVAGGAPSSAYGAAGLPGVWNSIGVLAPYVRAPLVGLSGAPVAAQIYMYGGTEMLVEDDPLTSGDDAALVDDMLIGFNNPVDVCIWIEGLEIGVYEVLTYAITPSNAALTHRVRVDFGSPGPVFIGGAWPGAHQAEITYARHEVSITTGTLGLHSGWFGTGVTSGINGIQIRRIDGCYADCNADGALSVADFGCFQTRFVAGDPYADCNGDGVRTVADFGCFQTAFVLGCP